MIQTINESQFIDAFEKMGREDQFSYEGLKLIYEYFEELDPSFDLDVIAICCEFAEAPYEQVASEYNIGEGEDLNPEDIPQAVIDYLQDNTSVVGYTDDSIVYVQF
jgi:hypothetical protein